MKRLIRIIRKIAGHTQWHECTKGDRFVWRKWTAEFGWVYREMTEKEAAEAFHQWAIK